MPIVTIMLFLVVFLLLLIPSNIASSQLVETLPGFPARLPFKLETGYVGVGESEAVQLFYYFVESERKAEEDPLVLWLTGGPGCSAFSGLVYEVGPLLFDYAKSSSGRERLPTLKLNPYSWTKVSNMIFVDAPVGTGFSYATTSEAYEASDTSSATQAYEFLRKWLLSHPWFLRNPLFISGDSYSGIVLPMIVKKISDGNDAGLKPEMNLKGYSLGNPITDLSIDLNWKTDFAHRTGLISDKLYESTKRHCHGEYLDVDPSNTACLEDLESVSECINEVNIAQILEPNCDLDAQKLKGWAWPKLSIWDPSILNEDSLDLLSASQQHSGRWCRAYNYVLSYIWANDETVQTALHIRKGTKKEWSRCNETIEYSSYNSDVQSSVPYHRNLTKKGYTALIYSGDHDMLVPYLGTQAWIKSLNLTEKSKWKPWYVERQVAGYTVEYKHNNYSLVYATVKGAGHTAPEYNPKECFAMFSRFLAGSSL